MVKLFSRLPGQNVPAASAPAGDTTEVFSDAQLLRAHFSVSTQAEEALSRFVTLISGQPGSEESRRLASRAVSRLRLGDTPDDACANSVLDDDGQRRGKWLLIQVDWKASEEVEWQANELLGAAQVTETWHPENAPDMTVAQVLLAFSSWVEQRGFHLLHLDLQSDSYYALLVPAHKLREAISAAEEAGVKLEESCWLEAGHMHD